MGTVLNLTKPNLTPQDREDIRTEVARFEVLYQERYGALKHLQRANLTRAYQNLVELGIGLEDRQVIERLLLAYDGDHKDLDAYIRELYYWFFDINDKQALPFIDTASFKGELECQGYCFAPSLDGTVYHVFND